MKLSKYEKQGMGSKPPEQKAKPEYPVVTKKMAEAAGMKPTTVRARMRNEGLSLEEALTRPLITKQEMGVQVSSYMKNERKNQNESSN